MAVRELKSAPQVLPLYLRAAAPLVPGASLLPFVPGGGKEIPDLELTMSGVRTDPAVVAAYARVCGLTLTDELPATYPQILAFPLHMALMADGRFPFGAIGLVHVSNRIVQHRPLRIGEPLDLRVRATPLVPHSRGRTFALVSEVRVDDELVWNAETTILRRGGGGGDAAKASADGAKKEAPAKGDAAKATAEKTGASGEAETGPANAQWRLPGDLGRRYGAVSGDRNPIHMHSLTAKPLGFPRAIAHGMWTKARCLGALQGRLPDAYAVEVRFRKPILLPSTVAFSNSDGGDAIDFAVRGARKGELHLEGRVDPAKTTKGKGGKAS